MFCGECGNEIAPGVKFCPQCGTKQTLSVVVDNAGGELRQLTVCFFDIVGSAALPRHVDAEVLHEIFSDFRGLCNT